ncbi:hypothetical protein GCM10010441_18090 [Kitasatospora paracochleata]
MLIGLFEFGSGRDSVNDLPPGAGHPAGGLVVERVDRIRAQHIVTVHGIAAGPVVREPLGGAGARRAGTPPARPPWPGEKRPVEGLSRQDVRPAGSGAGRMASRRVV